MTAIQILLLTAGAVIFALGFVLPVGKEQGGFDTARERKEYSEKLKELTNAELKEASRRVRDIIDEEVSLAHDNSSRSLEKLTNEKIMAINEYGRTVTEEIEKNHKEVVFMYDMLNDKTADLKNTIRKYENLEKTAKEVKKSPPKNEKAENIHIPKMFAAPGASGDKKTAQDSNVSAVTGRYGKDIIRLHKEGVTEIDIARKLGIGVGEVRLAISLNDTGVPDEA
ncbi:MAG: hypothetical protein J5966_03450 [Lachnospiraceae bacterium]|nr:hypothetical protein [Lachnospiraceae bacterium]